jgi:predicted ATPase/DNA-binding CsgD family transcriptional regulator
MEERSAMSASQAQYRVESLSPRELEILHLISNGFSNREIAHELYLSVETIKWYNRQIFMKLVVKNRIQAAKKAVELNLLGSEPALPSQEKSPLSGNLPAQLTPFVGREKETGEINELLKHNRLVVITGAGGMGKTRLATEIALAQHKHFNDGAYFIPLAPIESSTQMVSIIAEMIGFSFHEGGNQQWQLLEFLQTKTMLLVLDNFDHLLTETELVTKMLQTIPGLKIIITSRSRLNLQEELLYPIEGMDVPHDVESLEKANRSSAVKLFVQRACLVKRDFLLADDNVQEVIRICRLVEGMPLAILLAAAWVETISLAQIGREIKQDIDFLEMRYQDAPKRHWSIKAVFDYSWALMTEREQEIFKALSVFHGGFTRQAAQVVTKVSLLELRAYVNKSMITRASENRYQIHELLRQYATEKLTQNYTAYQAACDSHSAFYCAFLQTRESELKTEQRLIILAELKTELDNIRTAWNWAITQGQMDRLEQAMESLATLYQWMGRYRDGEESFRTLAIKMASSNSENGQRCLAKALIWQASFNRELGHTDLAMQLSRQSLDLLNSPKLSNHDTRFERAAALYCLGSATLRHDYGNARNLWKQSYKLYREIGEQWGMSHVLGYLSMIAWELGQYDEATRLIEKNLAIQQALGNKIDIGNMYSTLGWIKLTLGQFEQAEELARKCTTYYRETGDQAQIAKGFRDLAAPKIFLGEFHEASALLEESVATFKELGGGGDVVFTNIMLGEVKVHLGQYGQARSQEEFALQLARKFKDRAGEGRALLWLGRIALVEEEFDEAELWLQESTSIFREVGQKDQLGAALASLGHARRVLGDLDEAHSYLKDALRTALDIGAFIPLLFAIPLTALLAVDRRDKNGAVKLYALASRFPFVTHSRWYSDVFGRYIPSRDSAFQLKIEVDESQENLQNMWIAANAIFEETRK